MLMIFPRSVYRQLIRHPWRTLLAFTILVLLCLLFLLRVPMVVYYWVSLQPDEQHPVLWLPDYHAVVQAKPIAGIDNDLSGIAYHPDTDTLFAITNRPSYLLELNRDGDLLRKVRVRGASDTEDLTVIGHLQFLLVGEGGNDVYWVDLNNDKDVVRPWRTASLELSARYRNKGAEGIFWDAEGHRLLVGQEREPARLFTIPFVPSDDPSLQAGDVDEMRFGKFFSPYFIRDLSAVTRDITTGNRLLLSDDTHLIVEYAADGTLLSLLPLWRGIRGLKRTIPQAEGIATSPRGELFIVSEPNLFYRFEKTGVNQGAF